MRIAVTPKEILQRVNEEADVRFDETIDRLVFLLREELKRPIAYELVNFKPIFASFSDEFE